MGCRSHHSPDPTKNLTNGIVVDAFRPNPDPAIHLPGGIVVDAFRPNPDPAKHLPGGIVVNAFRRSAAPKGQPVKAQGNALGTNPRNLSKP
jgi:hypothetical protein